MHTRLIVLAALAAACGSSNPAAPGGCTFTLSGAITASGTCVAAGGNGYKSGSNGNGFGIVMNGQVAGVQSFAFALKFFFGRGGQDFMALT